MLPVSLEYKVTHALDLLLNLAQSFKPDEIALAFTGGKDSTVALHLWRLICSGLDIPARPKAISLDTGCKFPEVLEFRDRLAGLWRVDLHVVRPDPSAVINPGKDVLDCCRKLKIDPLLKTIRTQGVKALITGLRADESPKRSALPHQEAHPDHIRLHPLLNFTEMDIWAYIQTRELPYCVLYEKGYRSLGCMPCTSLPQAGGPERSGRQAFKEQNMERLRDLGYF